MCLCLCVVVFVSVFVVVSVRLFVCLFVCECACGRGVFVSVDVVRVCVLFNLQRSSFNTGVAETLRAPREMQDEMIKDYFYGPQKLLFPRAIELGFDEVKLYKIGAPELPAALLPYGK